MQHRLRYLQEDEIIVKVDKLLVALENYLRDNSGCYKQ